jgi:hypothetical protein
MLPTVGAATLAADQSLGFEPIQQTGDAWRLFDHPLRNFQRWQAFIASAAKNPEDVVLLQRDPVRLNHTRGIATHEISRSYECKNGFLSRGSKWTRLSQFALQRTRPSTHAIKVTCQ